MTDIYAGEESGSGFADKPSHCMYTMNVAVLLSQLDVIDSTAIFPILQLIKIHLQYEMKNL